MRTVLLAEDDENLNRGIALKLQKEGYRVLSAFCVREARELFDTNEVDLIISDIMLGDGSGLDFCADVRKKSNVYLIFLTAMDSEIDMVNAYDLGADDYITKPFSLMVLISKVHVCMRRMEGSLGNRLTSGELVVLCDEMKIFRMEGEGMTPLSLSKKETQLLICLMENAGRIVSKEQILERVWDVEGKFVDDNTVPVNISRLRSKLGNDYIQNVRGMGYIWIKESTRE